MSATGFDGPEHLPDRVTWDCLTCGRPWPCPPARTYLRATMSSANLGLYAALQMHDARPLLPDVSAGDMWTRFLGWIRAEPVIADDHDRGANPCQDRTGEPGSPMVPPEPMMRAAHQRWGENWHTRGNMRWR